MWAPCRTIGRGRPRLVGRPCTRALRSRPVCSQCHSCTWPHCPERGWWTTGQCHDSTSRSLHTGQLQRQNTWWTRGQLSDSHRQCQYARAQKLEVSRGLSSLFRWSSYVKVGGPNKKSLNINNIPTLNFCNALF